MSENTRLLTSREYSSEEIFKSVIIASVIVAFFNIFFMFAVVRGPSMEPTLCDGDVLLISRYSRLNEGDIVIAFPEDALVVKRVVDTSNGYYLMGDNRENSRDSRDYGTTDKIVGRVICRILPFKRL